MRRRLLIGLLLVLALAGGLWWNATRLNETERKLVGVWVSRGSDLAGTATILLANRREFIAVKENEEWVCDSEPIGKWEATPHSLVLYTHVPAPANWSLDEWLTQAQIMWRRENRFVSEIVGVTDNEIQLGVGIEMLSYIRSIDPNLQQIFNRLSAGESP